ncbi:MAG: VTT domain-containing protein [Patescibacteria group bacterium]
MITQSKILKIIAGIVVFVVIFWGSTIIENYVHTIVGFLANYIDNRSWMGAGVFMVLAVLSVMFVFFSSIWLVPIALLAWGNTLTAIMLFSSWLLGGIFSYLIGKYIGYPIVRKIISEEKINNYSDIFSQTRESFSLIVLSRFVLPSEVPSYLLGMVRYPFLKYLLATAISEIPYVFFAVYFVEAIIKKNTITFLIFGILWLGFALLMIRLYKKMTKK